MNNINDAIIKSITSPEISNLVTDFGDLGIDFLFDDESVKKIPVVGWFISFYKSGITIRDRMLLKKIVRFLSNLNEVPQLEKTKFIQEMNINSAFKQRVAENLLIVLDKLDEVKKADLIAKIFKEYMDGKIFFLDWLRFANIIERTLLHHLTNIPNYYSTNLTGIDLVTLQELYNVGLVSLSFNEYAPYVKNKTGLLLLKILFPEKKELYSSPLILPFATVEENEIFRIIIEKEIEVYPLPVVVSNLWDDTTIKHNNYYLKRFEKQNLVDCNTASDGIVQTLTSTENGFEYYYKELVENKTEIEEKILKKTLSNIESSEISEDFGISLKITNHILIKLSKNNNFDISALGSGALIVISQNY